jgi:hypothetical protein
MSHARQLIEAESSHRAFQAIHDRKPKSIADWMKQRFPKPFAQGGFHIRRFECGPEFQLYGEFWVNDEFERMKWLHFLCTVRQMHHETYGEIENVHLNRMPLSRILEWGRQQELLLILDRIVDRIEQAAMIPMGDLPLDQCREWLVLRIHDVLATGQRDLEALI